MFTRAVIFCLILNSLIGAEPVCSKFHYEEKTLERMIRQEVMVEKMKAEMEDIKHQVTDALSDLERVKNQISVELEQKADGIKAMKDGMEQVLTAMKVQNDENIQSYAAEIEKIKDANTTPLIAFKAHETTDKNLFNNKVIVFSENLLNIGDAYNNQTGIFVAPVDGIYLFTSQICMNNNNWIYFGIFLEGRLISSKAIGDRYWNSCSTFNSVTMVQQGEEVLVKCAESCEGTEKLWEYKYFAMNSFSGLLMRKL